MPNFDPAQPIPPEFESTIQTTPLIGQPQNGFAFGGPATDPNAASHQVGMTPMAETTAPNSGQAAQNASVLATLNAPVAPQTAPVASVPVPTVAAPVAQPASRQTVKAPVKPGSPGLGPLMDAAHPDTPIGSEGDAVDQALAEGAVAPNVPEPPANLTPEQAEVWKAGQESIRLNREKVAQAETQATIDKQAADEKAKVATAQEVEANQLYADQQKAQSEATALRKEEYKKFQSFAFHDFWKDRGAAREALAGIGVLLGSASYDSGHVNQAAQLIDKAITRDLQAQETELQHREKLASASAKNEQDLADLHGKMRASLRFRQEAQLNAVASKLESLSSLGKAQGNILAAKELANTARAHAAQFGVAGQKALEESISRRLDDERTRAQTRHINAETNKVRGETAGVGGKLSRKEAENVDKDVSKFETEARKMTEGTQRSPGSVQTFIKVQTLKDELNKAVASGDPQRIKGAIISVSEGAGAVVSGGRTTQFLGKAITDPKTLQDSIQEELGKITNNPTAGKTFVKTMQKWLTDVEDTQLERVKAHEETVKTRLFGPGGLAKTERAKANAMNIYSSFFKGVKQNGNQVFQIGEDRLPATAQSGPPSGAKPVTGPGGQKGFLYPDGTVHTADGKVIK